MSGLVADLLHLGEQVAKQAAVANPFGVAGGLGWQAARTASAQLPGDGLV